MAAGLAAGNGKRKPSKDVRYFARALRDEARETRQYDKAISEILRLIIRFPEVEEFQILVARLFGNAEELAGATVAWRGICARFPHSHDAFAGLLKATQKHEGRAAACALIEGRFVHAPAVYDELVAEAQAWEAVGAAAEAEAALERLTDMFSDNEEAWLLRASGLEAHGKTSFAADVLERAAKIAGASVRIGRAVEDFNARLNRGSSVSPIGVLGKLFDEVKQGRAMSSGADATHVPANMVLLTGSLGVGGSERQLVNTAIGLSGLGRMRGGKKGTSVSPVVSVIVKSMTARRDGAFFMPDLENAGIPIRVFPEPPENGYGASVSLSETVSSSLKYLPPAIRDGVLSLTSELRAAKPDVVQLWQDGIVYAAGLAAALAGVPRIILTARSVPPIDRRERYRPEYEIIYRSLLSAPGVTLTVNSNFAAARYAAWLDLDKARIAVIPNGVAPLPSVATEQSQALFGPFDHGGDNGFRIGTVMRFDHNKQPFLWLNAAARILAVRPDARFILVGDGPLRAEAMNWVRMNGLTNSFLFVGLSNNVGYWLSKMDLFMLVSKHEGLPNCLIEAQLARVPVITTPAGGAAETLIPGITGIVTREDPTPESIAGCALALIADADRRQKMGQAAEKWAGAAFSLSRMIEKTIDVFGDGGRISAHPI